MAASCPGQRIAEMMHEGIIDFKTIASETLGDGVAAVPAAYGILDLRA